MIQIIFIQNNRLILNQIYEFGILKTWFWLYSSFKFTLNLSMFWLWPLKFLLYAWSHPISIAFIFKSSSWTSKLFIFCKDSFKRYSIWLSDSSYHERPFSKIFWYFKDFSSIFMIYFLSILLPGFFSTISYCSNRLGRQCWCINFLSFIFGSPFSQSFNRTIILIWLLLLFILNDSKIILLWSCADFWSS